MKSFIKELIVFFHEYRFILLIALFSTVFCWFIFQCSLFTASRILENSEHQIFSRIDSLFKENDIIGFKLSDEQDEFYTIALDTTGYYIDYLFREPKNKSTFSAVVYHALIRKEKGYIIEAVLVPKGLIHYEMDNYTINDHLSEARDILNDRISVCNNENELTLIRNFFSISNKYYHWLRSDFDEKNVAKRIHMTKDFYELPHFVYGIYPVRGFLMVQDSKAQEDLNDRVLWVSLFISFVFYCLVSMFIYIKFRRK